MPTVSSGLKAVCSPLSCRSFPVMAALTPAVVSGQWLADAIQNKQVGPKLRVLDGSWYLPKSKRNTREEFLQKHIPGASFFNIDECCDKSSPYDHMLPTASDFSQYVNDLGIGNDTHVVVYDTSDFGSFSAPRVWWMFRVFGHNSVSVLDGGFKHWVADGHPVASDYTKPEKTDFKASLNQSWVKSYEDVLENIKTKKVQVVDARSGGRFQGTDPEPRGDIQSGHFLGAINMPYTTFLEPNGKHKSTEALTKLFENAGVDPKKPIWASCGSGVTACHVLLAADRLGHTDLYLYDGAWVEWFKRASPELIISEGEGKKA
ncbi:3-mercaptopyruvate sulfurtransferase-like isoform X2 [Poecilia formosa]|uniref:3-mercaptopyruvate sulfurtransferase-like isoform X2 n=1 Tax=Poecilia formosa TaxID=48698 RepID=UPI0007BA480F|nr:PREDICTED: 3-mercaptopyruvate sulfurtransferase-like isoform X2 [Poecilia formosa]